MYKVIRKDGFQDLKTDHYYKYNDVYPFNYTNIDKTRLDELSTIDNQLNEVIIEKVVDIHPFELTPEASKIQSKPESK